ncbi:MAG: LysM peptidoglycan-binding domain-containing protein [Planctomycetes bacterium]|nr:LysM peptidoglycan-binding domain-containing protein [Planctomycetota bacterium]MBL7107420.1 LysM peptidoglycan-binding domain-containing protein [Phycisphaerae bacterium]
MTSDAKIGLLLGLVFIFIIAFVVNGLPNLRNSDNNQLTTNMVAEFNKTPAIDAGLGGKAELSTSFRSSYAVVEPQKTPAQPAPQANNANQSQRYVVELPASQPSSERGNSGSKVSKYYVVQSGDSLASIAKKFYGEQQGNRRVNIDRIYKANGEYLKSPDTLYVGQKLVIPSLTAKDNSSESDSGALKLAEGMFEKVKSIGARHLGSDKKQTTKDKVYVVREGDSLWKIAERELGNGSRFSDITELNARMLSDEDSLVVGMRLRIP